MAYQGSGSIRCVEPFSLARSLQFLDGFSPMRGEQRTSCGALEKAIMHRGQAVCFTVRQASAGSLAYQWSAARAVTDEKILAERIGRFVSADQDLAPFHALADGDRAFAPLARRLRGLHHVTFPSPFEAACWGTLNQRIGFTVARRMKSKLTRALGGSVEQEGVVHWAFPEPEPMARAGADELEAIIGNARKAKTLAAIARAFADGGEELLRRAPLDEAEAWLRKIHGVGPFTSGFVLFRGLGRFVRLPVAPALIAAAEQIYRRALTVDGLQEIAGAYGEWAGQWALYLWASTFVPPALGDDRVEAA